MRTLADTCGRALQAAATTLPPHTGTRSAASSNSLLLPLWDCPAGKQQVFSKAAVLEAEQAVLCHVPFAKFADALTMRYREYERERETLYLLDKVCLPRNTRRKRRYRLLSTGDVSPLPSRALPTAALAAAYSVRVALLPEWTG